MGELKTLRVKANEELQDLHSLVTQNQVKEVLEKLSAGINAHASSPQVIVDRMDKVSPVADGLRKSLDAWWDDELASAYKTIEDEIIKTHQHLDKLNERLDTIRESMLEGEKTQLASKFEAFTETLAQIRQVAYLRTQAEAASPAEDDEEEEEFEVEDDDDDF